MISPQDAWDLKFSRSMNENEILEVVQLLHLIGDPGTSSVISAAENVRHWRCGNGKGFSVASVYSA